jgi:hypothetical protein
MVHHFRKLPMKNKYKKNVSLFGSPVLFAVLLSGQRRTAVGQNVLLAKEEHIFDNNI